jgi:hypothetical protein
MYDPSAERGMDDVTGGASVVSGTGVVPGEPGSAGPQAASIQTASRKERNAIVFFIGGFPLITENLTDGVFCIGIDYLSVL